jgi:hypothetical protein
MACEVLLAPVRLTTAAATFLHLGNSIAGAVASTGKRNRAGIDPAIEFEFRSPAGDEPIEEAGWIYFGQISTGLVEVIAGHGKRAPWVWIGHGAFY